MTFLLRDDYFKRVNEIVGDNTSDEALSFIEDMTETYDTLESRKKDNEIDWEQKYKENDEAWRKKYRQRFFSGYRPGVDREAEDVREEVKITPETIKIEDLFHKKDEE